MTGALKIDFAGPFVTIQDGGRPGYMRFGVPRSGPMDRAAFAILKRALGGGADFTAIEVSVGGLALKCTAGPVTCGFVGGDFSVTLNEKTQPPWSVFTLAEGVSLKIRPGPKGSWGYLGFCGAIESESWLGSQAALLTSGLCGAPLVGGDIISLDAVKVKQGLNCTLPIPDFTRFDGTVRAVAGPQDFCFPSDTLDRLNDETFTITQDYDRMGMRLSGCKLTPEGALSIPSEALIRGSVQVPGHGDPLILLADHQTTGGYPKIATVISADQDRLTQARAGDELRFRLVTQEDAIAAARRANSDLGHYLDAIEGYRGSLSERLQRANLISGVVGPEGEER